MPLTDTKLRLDLAVVARGLTSTRSQARDLIERGCVLVGGRVVTKPGREVADDEAVILAEGVVPWVSRGALKLIAALDHFRFPVAGIAVLDIGASSGGFTEVLVARGARQVYAVDIGHGQLHARLAGDSRVIALEGCDARRLDQTIIPEAVDAVVADVSFISLTKALPVPLTLTHSGCWLVALIKPQFEAGRAAVGKGGIVRDPAARRQAVELVRGWVTAQHGWRVLDVIPSPIAGGSGNAEFLLGAVRDH